MDFINDAIKHGLNVTFDVTSPNKAYAGHTVYRLSFKIQNAIDASKTRNEFIGWKRFSEFQKLYKLLKADFETIFASCFPDFPKRKLFGRFDEAVIEERRLSSMNLMNFVVQYPLMTQHFAFQGFVKAKRTFSTSISSASSLSISPSENCSITSCHSEIIPESNNMEVSEAQNIEHTLEYDNSNVILDTDETDETDEVFLTNQNEDGRKLWLREAHSICGDDLESLALEAPCNFSVTSRAGLFDDTSILLTESPDDFLSLTDKSSFQSDVIRSCHDLQIQSKLQDKFLVDDKMSRIINQTIEEDDYIFQASVSMSNAIEQEELGNFDAAFEMYKFGIGLLLRGVQIDDNTDRQDAVRRKTAQYLLRAEQLYISKLHPKSSNIPEEKILLEDNKWRFRLNDVRVFGVIDKVMLVQKIYTDEVYIMKVLHKQGGVYKQKFRQKKPRNLYNTHFMVKLINCVETQTGVYLLLQHVQGRLWDFLNLPLFVSNRLPTYSVDEYLNGENVKETSKDVNNVDCMCDKFSNSSSDLILNRELNWHSFNDRIKIWAAQIVLGVSELHSRGIICRDLNPLNILLDSNGVVKLTYFSNVEGIDYNLNADAVQFLYASPEVNGVFETASSTDWWSVGAILFELITGKSLYSCHPGGINNRSVIVIPCEISNEAHSLLAGLLKFHPTERLGAGPTGFEEIKSHPYFSGIDWELLLTKKSI